MLKGIILNTSHSNFFVEFINKNKFMNCKLKGNIKNKKEKLVPGDNVNCHVEESTCLIVDFEKRKNIILRPKVANVDQLIIVQSIDFPRMRISQIYKYIAFYNWFKVYNISIAITKTDLIEGKKVNLNCLINDGFKIYNVNDSEEFRLLNKNIINGLTVFIGQSGVGKSTLLNKIDRSFSIKTNEISKKLNRGKHTTTLTHLHKHINGYVADTPGFSSFDFLISKEEFTKCFKIFRDNSHLCKFRNCVHINELGCEIKKLVFEKKISFEMYNFYNEFMKKNF